ncbi:MAG: NADH-quinone oxidoreductase subunit B, partial [Caulobacteraceae bacterium]
MGVITASTPALAGGRAGVVGYRPESHEPFFDGVTGQLADKGYVIAALDDLITWARTGSLMFMSFGL